LLQSNMEDSTPNLWFLHATYSLELTQINYNGGLLNPKKDTCGKPTQILKSEQKIVETCSISLLYNTVKNEVYNASQIPKRFKKAVGS
jgi:hypothetical protein